jgi:protoporphyrinogen oxidase
MSQFNKKAIIIGAGPAGLTAAYELLTRAPGIQPIVLEKSDYLGGISRTVRYKGNRMDIGGHRFFSKSDRVMEWWLMHLPMENKAGADISYQNQSRRVNGNSIQPDGDRVMLLRARKSRIYFMRKFFDYPISLTTDTLRKLGVIRTMRIGMSYLRRAIFPLREQKNLEQFFINRFGGELYRTFFKSYTEKVWGVSCQEIDAEWGAQRIKELSVWKTVLHFVSKSFSGRPKDVAQKGTETSLIEQFLYPKFGPGQMWETVAEKVKQMGAVIVMEQDVARVHVENGRVTAVTTQSKSGESQRFDGDYFFSTMPMQELIRAMDCAVPEPVRSVSDGLIYRDFITVGLLLQDMKIKDETPAGKKFIADNWIYIQEPDVFAGRLQIFNNWSPHLVATPGTVWMGVEYFCNEGDGLWTRSDDEMKQLAAEELDKIGIIEQKHVLDATVIRMPKTYPAYFGTYNRFHELREWLDAVENLFLVGRNGMHRYNNQDHSMLTAMTAVDNIIAGRLDKANIWDVNTEMEYHESKETPQAAVASAK